MEAQKIISLVLALALFLVVREGFQMRDRIDWNKSLSKAWHWFGFLMRLMVVGIMYLVSRNWWLTLLVAFMLSVLYNIACNIGLKRKWYYVSKSGIDGLIRKILPFVNFDK